jgi:hypothetical protein
VGGRKDPGSTRLSARNAIGNARAAAQDLRAAATPLAAACGYPQTSTPNNVHSPEILLTPRCQEDCCTVVSTRKDQA